MNLHESTSVNSEKKKSIVVRCAEKERGYRVKEAVVVILLGNSSPLWYFRSMLEGSVL